VRHADLPACGGQDRVKRDLTLLADETFDLLVVGGGVFGACLAWDAAQRGLKAALVEKDDFCGAASANSFRMVHGGIRYLQHLDIPRLRESARERTVLLRIAPHLVKPLPIAIPTYGRWLRGKAVLRAGFGVYDLLTADRNLGIGDPRRLVPRSRFLSRTATLELFPGLPRAGLTGAGVFHDGQMHHPVRLGLAFLRSAYEAGAVLANHAEAVSLLRRGDRVTGARVAGQETGEEIDVRARVTVVAAGAWTERFIARSLGQDVAGESTFSRDLCLLTGIRAPHAYGLAVPGETRDPDALVSRQRRHLFLVPWRGRLIVGVWHRVHRGSPEALVVQESELAGFVQEFHRAHPSLGLTMEDVVAYNTGLVLFGENREGATDLRYGKRSRLVDHRSEGVAGLISLIGVRYTTARTDAARALDLAFSQLGSPTPRCRTEETPVWGGDFETVEDLEAEIRGADSALPPDVVSSLRRNYGSRYGDVLASSGADRELRRPLGESGVLGIEVIHAVRREMALHLEDVVMRRTDLGFLGTADRSAVERASRLMATELGWAERRREKEVEAVWPRVSGPGRLVPSPSDR